MITHGAVADVSVVSGSDRRFHVGLLQIAVRQPYMEGEQTTPEEERQISRQGIVAIIIP